MSEETKNYLGSFVCGFLLSLILIMAVMDCSQTLPRDMQEKAINAGVAEYYLDANHNKQFRWKPPTPNAAMQQEASE